jgi:serine/threonine protein kinase|tara:strand:- start:185 stop:592 length:408 start_codon:yes stop_codon:yes gene_type:complete
VLQRKCGTPSYVAPEILDGDDGYGKPADMWSVGVVMFLVLRGKLPFQGDTDKEITHGIVSVPVVLNDKQWRRRSSELRDFVSCTFDQSMVVCVQHSLCVDRSVLMLCFVFFVATGEYIVVKKTRGKINRQRSIAT